MLTCVSSHVRVIRLSSQFCSANSRLFVVFDSGWDSVWDPEWDPEFNPEWIETPRLDLAALGRMVKVHWLPNVPRFWPSAIALNRLLVSVRFWETLSEFWPDWSEFWSDWSEKSGNKYAVTVFNHGLCYLIGKYIVVFWSLIVIRPVIRSAGPKYSNFSQSQSLLA